MSKIKRTLAFLSPSRKTGLDRFLDENCNAYGRSGFIARTIGLLPVIIGALYFIYDDADINSYPRGLILSAAAITLFLISLYRLISDYSKEGRKAHQGKMHKDALMEAEILERKEAGASAQEYINDETKKYIEKK
jgi:hypothetical protein